MLHRVDCITEIKALWWIPGNQFVADRGGSWSRSRFLQEEWTRNAVWRDATNTKTDQYGFLLLNAGFTQRTSLHAAVGSESSKHSSDMLSHKST